MWICLEIVYFRNQVSSAKYWHQPCGRLVLVTFLGVFISLLVPCLNWEFKSDFFPSKSQRLAEGLTSINAFFWRKRLYFNNQVQFTVTSLEESEPVIYTHLSVQLVPSPLGSTSVKLWIRSRFLIPHLSQVSLVELVGTIYCRIRSCVKHSPKKPFKQNASLL